MQSKPGSFCEIAAAATYISVSAPLGGKRGGARDYDLLALDLSNDVITAHAQCNNEMIRGFKF